LFFNTSDEKKRIWSFIGKYYRKDLHLPYPFALKYRKMNFEVEVDEATSLPFLIHNGRKLFFPRGMNKKEIKETYRELLTEQDSESAHRYVDSLDRLSGKALLDIGAAEGIISLDAVDVAKYIYLFEYQQEWIEALEATFAPYAHKVEIVKKYVSNADSDNSTSLDSFFTDKPFDDLFLKMDIEGSEMNALEGASNILSKGKNINFAICIYHNEDDYKLIPAFLQNYGYDCEITQGYILLGNWWLRKGVVRKKYF
jgi:predicted RNA methylase